MAYSENVAAFFEALGPFYEYVELPNGKNSDSNHNITEKCLKEGSPHNFEMISLCNGKASPNMNGMPNSDDSDQNDETGAKPKSSAGPKLINGLDENFEKNFSSKHNDVSTFFF